jgi:hypothetical protein
MKLLIVTDVCDHLRSYKPGDLVELPDDQAERLIAQGMAELAAAAAKVVDTGTETATAEGDHETATMPRPKKR